MIQPSTLLLVDADVRGLETLTFGFERDGYKVTSTSDLGRAPQLAKSSSASLAIVSLREPETSALGVIGALRDAAKDLAVVALGPAGMKSEALGAGAVDFLPLPIFLRDVISVGKLSTVDGRRPRDGGTEPDEIQMRLSEHHGLFYLLRAMASSERSGVLQLNRGNRRAELRIHEGTVVSATVGALQGLPALHHLLLWEEAALSLTRGTVRTRSQLHLSAQEVLDECERFLRDFAHAARDLGAPRTLYVAAAEPQPAVRGLQPSQITPLLRLFDGRRVLSDVIEESPFRIFDTVRMIRRLRDSGVLSVRPEKPDPARKTTPPGGPAIPGRNGAPRSMFEQWAMVPDQRGVVGDRRSTNRKLRPLQTPLRGSPVAAGAPRRSAMTPPRTAPLV
ncbi:MAG TPA: response regulator, partial [Polyangia bacterium]|nr:response regulator [Polyangia bacterium]